MNPSRLDDVRSSTGLGRVWSPVVDQHATWIALNPIQGCPKACSYCFLHERGQAAVRPEALASPDAAVELLLASEFYEPDRPVALYTWTDVMARPDSRAHMAFLLEVIARRRLTNPVVLITKCHVPDDTIEMMRRIRDQGVRLVAYLSYSGLGADIERGIRRVAVVDNFPRLTQAGVPVVHYWRPSMPSSATQDRMREVMDWASRFARCTIAAGLKVESAALPRLAALWPGGRVSPWPPMHWKVSRALGQSEPGEPTSKCSCATDHPGHTATRCG